MRALRHARSRAAVVFLSIADDEQQVTEAIRLGGRGYVVKTHMRSHLASALDHALLGRQFLPSLTSWLEETPRSGHAIHVHTSDVPFENRAANYFLAALRRGDAACFIGSDQMRDGVESQLRTRGWDISRSSPNRYLAVDAQEALHRFLRDGMPDANRLSVIVEELDDFRRAVTDGAESRLVIAGCLLPAAPWLPQATPKAHWRSNVSGTT